VADTHRLRIYVQVPQAYAAQVRTGMNATLEFTDHPGQHYAATVASTAHALDATSRTLQVELQIDNNGGELLPGAYVQVSFSLTPTAGTLRVPVNAVIFRGKSPQVATVDATHRVRLHDITEGRDFGTEVEVLAGIGPDDTVILNPPDSIADGTEVRLQPPQQPAQPQQGSGEAAREHS
jgi:RND family efflux transporter MFP subunit